ncbi:thioesterase domain-containing protein [Histoplasma capsulatum]|uniref:Thioesterase domain-containing protein n=1 Tax=Ajellomyces capsulatus TaxID=5037 RepID=A0A8A1M2A6_AJECA|nr:thioesterase domain-containing protein [Histoplasma capsulatum]
MEDCIYMIQSAPPGLETATPLVLVHDGGGTIVSYCYLDSLDRAVYGIQNPRLYSGQPWDGGLPEMARVYADLILSVVPSGPLLLGGWSLGGLLSLEVANILLRTSAVRVLGLVMIDSIYPLAISQAVSNVVGPQPVFSKDTRAETRQLVSHCMELAQSMVDSWIPPVWRGCSDSGLILKRTELEKELSLIEPRPPAIMEDHADAVAPANITYSDMKNGTTASNANIDFPSIPKTILLRCDDYVPVSMPDTPDAVCRVDVVRELRSLGWEKYPHHFTPAVLNVSGHHFNLFTDEYIDQISIQIRQSCKMLERDS